MRREQRTWAEQIVLMELERENARLRRVVVDLALEKQVLKDVASGNS